MKQQSIQTRLCKPLSASLLLVLLAIPGQIWGWGNTGHEAVAYVAWQNMTPTTRARVIELLKRVPALHPTPTRLVPGYKEWVADLPAGFPQEKQDLYLFMRAATWPDTIKHVGFTDSDVPPSGITNDVNIGFSDTKSHGYWHFVDKGFASDHSSVPATPAPNVITQVLALRAAIGSTEDDDLKSYDLIWLEHLVGDIHQPLHGTVRYFGNAGDRGGNLVVIRLPSSMAKAFEGTQSTSAPRELHAFWDDLPGEGRPSSVLTDAENFAAALPQASTASIADTDPSDWAMESFTLAKKDAYVSPIGKGLRPTAHSSYLMTDAYYSKAMQDAKDRVALAGARLAKLLNDNLK